MRRFLLPAVLGVASLAGLTVTPSTAHASWLSEAIHVLRGDYYYPGYSGAYPYGGYYGGSYGPVNGGYGSYPYGGSYSGYSYYPYGGAYYGGGYYPNGRYSGGGGRREAPTGPASHEIMEAATDPYNKQSPAYAYVDDDHFAFMFVLGGESGDLCAQEEDAFYRPTGYPYVVQRNWSNIAARSGKDPCLPRSGAPWFTAAPTLVDNVDLFGAPTRGVRVPAGTAKTIDLDLFSEDPAGTMQVDVVDASYALGVNQMTQYSLDRSSGKNGDTLKLTVTAQAGASDTELFMVVLNGGGKMRVAWVGAVGH